jgi:hypothetical protein
MCTGWQNNDVTYTVTTIAALDDYALRIQAVIDLVDRLSVRSRVAVFTNAAKSALALSGYASRTWQNQFCTEMGNGEDFSAVGGERTHNLMKFGTVDNLQVDNLLSIELWL